MYAQSPVLTSAVPSLPELLARVPLPAEAWKRMAAGLPEPLQRILALRRRLPAFPHLTGRQIFAAAVPAGLMLGWLVSFAVDPDIAQHGGKPYADVVTDGVRVELPRLAYEEAYPEDPAPFGYGAREGDPGAAIAIAETADDAGAEDIASVKEVQAPGEEDSAPAQQPRFTSHAVIEVVPQDTPL